MITKIEIKNNKRTPFRYTKDLKSFKNGKTYTFKQGVNIIVGNNGCGKSTLLNIIASFMLCSKSMASKVPDKMFEMDRLWDDEDTLLDGVKIYSDYRGVVYKFKTASDMSEGEKTSGFENFSLAFTSATASTGEKTMAALQGLFDTMFSNKYINFPLGDLIKIKKDAASVWSYRVASLLQYYNDNLDFSITPDNFEYTVLMDEPDKNLDIDNLQEIYGILGHRKPLTQLIAVVHNPILIYKLSKLEGENKVNFIEMSKDYVKKIVDYVESK